MKHAGLFAALVLCSCAIGVVGCRRRVPEMPVEGQVFLVLKTGSSTKLALASVYLLNESQATNHAKAAVAACAETLRVARYDVERDADAIRRERADIVRARTDQHDKLLEEIEAMKQRGDYGQAYTVKVREAAKIESEIADDDVGDATITKLRDKQREAALRFPDELAAALADVDDYTLFARTDADGMFRINVPNDGKRKALLIVAERQVDKEERFVWFVWLDKMSADSGKLLFANHNDLRQPSSANVMNVFAHLPTAAAAK